MRTWALSVFVLGLVACSDETPKGAVGDACGYDHECMSGLCASSVCLDPDADEDGDGLINAVENALGSDPFSADSDGDGVLDPDELNPGLALRDSDGDGKPDILESRLTDSDGDCLADELDPEDTVFATKEELYAYRVELCDAKGVCAAQSSRIELSCVESQVLCSYEQIAEYEVEESRCGDGLDNDCDGEVDEDCPDIEPQPEDSDGDGIWDLNDNCPNVPNSAQVDSDLNGVGDACDTVPSPTLTYIEPVELTLETASFLIEASGAVASTTSFFTDEACSRPLGVPGERNDSLFLIRREPEVLLYAQSYREGQQSSCVRLGTLLGPLSLKLETPYASNVPRPVQLHDLGGGALEWAYVDETGVVSFQGAFNGLSVTLVASSPSVESWFNGEVSNDYQLFQFDGLKVGELTNLRIPNFQQNAQSREQVLIHLPEMAEGASTYYVVSACGMGPASRATVSSSSLWASFDINCLARFEHQIEFSIVALGPKNEPLGWIYEEPVRVSDSNEIQILNAWESREMAAYKMAFRLPEGMSNPTFELRFDDGSDTTTRAVSYEPPQSTMVLQLQHVALPPLRVVVPHVGYYAVDLTRNEYHGRLIGIRQTWHTDDEVLIDSDSLIIHPESISLAYSHVDSLQRYHPVGFVSQGWSGELTSGMGLITILLAQVDDSSSYVLQQALRVRDLTYQPIPRFAADFFSDSISVSGTLAFVDADIKYLFFESTDMTPVEVWETVLKMNYSLKTEGFSEWLKLLEANISNMQILD